MTPFPILLRLVLMVPLLAALGACSTPPFQVPPPDEVVDGLPGDPEPETARGRFDFDPTPRAIALCYGKSFNTWESVVMEAREICPHGLIEFKGEDFFWNGCALLQPTRASFVCYPEPPPDA